MSTITEQPKGLVGLFGLRDMGAVPRELSGVIAPVIDITQFTLTNRESLYTGVITASSVGNLSMGLTVPPGELWYVHSWTISTSVLTAGQAIEIKPLYWESNFTVYGRGNRAGGVAGDSVLAGSDRMFIATPGSQLQVYIERITAGPIGIGGSALITRIKV